MSDNLQLDGVDLVFDDGSARSVDLVLVECPTCHGKGPPKNLFGLHCPDCEGVGWVLVEGAPIDLADLERMAPWADEPVGRPLESGEVDGIH